MHRKQDRLSGADQAARYAEVAVFSALKKTLHYTISDDLEDDVHPGSVVLVPLGAAAVTGLVLKLASEPPAVEENIVFKPVLAVAGSLPRLPMDLLTLGQWVSNYYYYPLGETLYTILPPGIRRRPKVVVRARSSLSHQARDGEFPEFCRPLLPSKQMSLPELKARLGSPRGFQRSVNKLIKEGWIEKQYHWTTPPEKSPPVKMIHLVTRPDLKRYRNPARLTELLTLLEAAGGSVALRELRREISNIDYWVRKLTEDGCLEIGFLEQDRCTSYAQDIPDAATPRLTPDQQKVVDTITSAFSKSEFQPITLYGVTGSGKTEAYLRSVEVALSHRKRCLVLVPEIALSTQLEALFRQRFGTGLAVWHSALSASARFEQWCRIASGRADVILGVRSAIFSPIPDLGLIVIDEEHDSSYKQEDRLRYHARDVALVRAKLLNIPILLGSATPSLQTIHHCFNHRYQLLQLTKRIDNQPLPDLCIVDMRRQRGPFRFLSDVLQDRLRTTLESGRQALLFLNRRGFASFLLCRTCGQVVQCRNCSVSLTYHQAERQLCCHYCGFTAAYPDHCPTCSKPSLLPFGVGTERIEEEVRNLLPRAKIVRIDRDTANKPEELICRLNTVRQGQADILIGTQMLAKGHDFPGIALVGVVNADTSLQIADFRAGENTVQLLMQVAGRAGRGKETGEVLLQTYNPDHYTMRCVQEMDYLEFCRRELESRKTLQYPPFNRFIKFLVTASEPAAARNGAQGMARLCHRLISRFQKQDRYLAMLGPAPAPLTKLKNRYRWHFYVKAWNNGDIQDLIEQIMEQAGRNRELHRLEITVDRDPVSNY